MANEILYTGIGNLRTATELAGFYALLLAERGSMGALSHPALTYAGSAKPGSTVVQVPEVGLMGYDEMTDGTEGSDPGNTALTDGKALIDVGIKEKIYAPGDLARMTDPYGMFSAETMARDLVASAAQKLIDMVVALATGFTTNVVGNSGVNLTISDFIDGITALDIASAEAIAMAILHPRQWGDLAQDTLSVGGTPQMRTDVSGIADFARGYKGQLFGVDCFASNRCDTSDAGANVNGLFITPGAIYWADGQYTPEPGDPNILDLSLPGLPVRGRLERDRDGRSGLTAWILRVLLGVIEGQDAAGVRVRSDA